MEENEKLSPDFIFEVSWEVCNKVGGIHTVLASKALEIIREWEDNYVLIGPDIWKGTGEHPEFLEDKTLFNFWKEQIEKSGLKVRIGRWKVIGNPLVVLVDFTSLFGRKNELFKNLWLDFHVDSLSGQWDYIEPTLFGYAAGMVIECFYHCHLTLSDLIVAHFHEWLTAAGILYLEKNVPQMATIFTSHATVVGRTIAGNHLPFYSKFDQYNAEQESKRWNVVSKFSLEKAGANVADCFTTVSEITARECNQFLGRVPDVITYNGFDDAIVPNGYQFDQKRKIARNKLLEVARAVTGKEIGENPLLVLKSGRYEFRNKGIDIFLEALNFLNNEKKLKREVVAFICVPGHHTGPRAIVQNRLNGSEILLPEKDVYLTHYLQGIEEDPIIKYLKNSGLNENKDDKVRVIFAPVYLDGKDGVFDIPYYELLPGFDFSAFPSYYEPWGYTPLESLAFHVPTVTTDVTGFGQFIKNYNTGVFVLHRTDSNQQEVVKELASIINQYTEETNEKINSIREAAYILSKITWWKKMIGYYKTAYDYALRKTKGRKHLFDHDPSVSPLESKIISVPLANKPVWRKIFIQPTFPEELLPLFNLAKNLWWSWNKRAEKLFESVAPDLWEIYAKNPIALLNSLSLEKINSLVENNHFLKNLDEVDQLFETYMAKKHEVQAPLIAYFCMEFGLVSGLKLYAGGLGILAGDFLKEVSDSNKNIIGVGLLYRKGYFKQRISIYGDQVDEDDTQKFTHLPLEPVRDKEGEWIKINIAFPGRTLYAKAWRVSVGRTFLYLLDADIPENRKEDRLITDHLYAGDKEYRLKQELLLGIGGVRLLQVLDKQPSVYHCNEGHAAFLGLERLSLLISDENITFDEALELVRASTLFTTHTPVDAGHDRFSEDLIRIYLAHYTNGLNISWDRLMAMGRAGSKNQDEEFSMSYLAARVSQEINGVSQINEDVSRRIYHPLWYGATLKELPIGHVTNGIHYGTWTGPEWQKLYEETLGKELLENIGTPALWEKIKEVPDQLIWQTHCLSKKKLIEVLKKKLKADLEASLSVSELDQLLENLDENAMFIGFARRFVTYKRATLLFYDLDRLEKIVNNTERPVIILFAGKAHPRDNEAKSLIKKITTISWQKRFLGKIVFLENYDMEMAQYLVRGVDLWLNTPERGMEASGTSGMKAAFNGVLSFSVLDGWWSEAYDKNCGWALKNSVFKAESYMNSIDAKTLYKMLEEEIAPSFFNRKEGLSKPWISKMKHAIIKFIPQFNTSRMLEDYFQNYYSKLNKRFNELQKDNFSKLKILTEWKRNVQRNWPMVKVVSMKVYDSFNEPLLLGEDYYAELTVDLNGLSAEDLVVEIVFIKKRETNKDEEIIFSQKLDLVNEKENTSVYSCSITMTHSGVYEYSFRLYPNHTLLPYAHDLPLVKWL